MKKGQAEKTLPTLDFRSAVQYRIGGFFADHVDRRDDEEARDFREHRRVDDAQPLNAADAELAVQYRHGVVVGADRAGAGGVMSPGVVADEVAQLLLGLHIL